MNGYAGYGGEFPMLSLMIPMSPPPIPPMVYYFPPVMNLPYFYYEQPQSPFLEASPYLYYAPPPSFHTLSPIPEEDEDAAAGAVGGLAKELSRRPEPHNQIPPQYFTFDQPYCNFPSRQPFYDQMLYPYYQPMEFHQEFSDGGPYPGNSGFECEECLKAEARPVEVPQEEIERIEEEQECEEPEEKIEAPASDENAEEYDDPRGPYCKFITITQRGVRVLQKPKKERVGNGRCAFCKSNRETPHVWKSHSLKDKSGDITCPILQNLVCPACGETGKKAHSLRYCPKLKKWAGTQGQGTQPSAKQPAYDALKFARNASGEKILVKL